MNAPGYYVAIVTDPDPSILAQKLFSMYFTVEIIIKLYSLLGNKNTHIILPAI